MKNAVFILISFFIGQLSYTQKTSLSAQQVLNPAYEKAKKANKKILLIFHASWCGWCKKMEASLNDNSVQSLIKKNYEVVWLDVNENDDKKSLENAGALNILTKLGGADQGLPFWFVLDKDGNKLADSKDKAGQNVGCPATQEEVTVFINILRKTSNLNETQLKPIEARFRKNE